MRTTARRDGDEYVIDGAKAWTTHGGVADFYKVMARTSEGSGGISCFLVPADTPGLSADPPERKMGLTGSATATMRFDGVRVPVERRLGEEGEGLQDRARRARRRPARHRLGGHRPGAGRARPRRRLREGAGDLRPPHPRPPGPRLRAGRHGGRGAVGPRHHPRRRPAQGPRPPLRAGGLDRQAGGHRQRHEGHHRRRPGARRLRLHQGLPRRAVHARGEGDADLRGHEPDPAARRQPPPRPRPAGTIEQA